MWSYLSLGVLLLLGVSRCSQEFSRAVKYDVIIKTKHMFEQDQLFQNLDMVSKYGQKFTCRLPKVNNETDTSYFPSINNTYIHNLLSPLNQSKCIFLTKDWWTYELCYGKIVLQFHEELGNKLSETILGRFESETDWDVETNSTHTDTKFHSQFYTNGSLCDVTSKPRTTEVRYTCGSGKSFQIVSVDETETCAYLFVVETPLLCAHPAFVTKVPRKVEEIICAADSLTPSDEPKAGGDAEESQLLKHSSDRTPIIKNPRSQQRRSFTLKNLYSRVRARHQKVRAHRVKIAIKNFNQAIDLLMVDMDMDSLRPSFVWKLFFQSMSPNNGVRYSSFSQFMQSYELQVIQEQFKVMLTDLLSITRRFMDNEPNVFIIPIESAKLVCDLGEKLATALEMKINENSGYFVTVSYNVSHLQTALNSFKMIYHLLLDTEAPTLSYDKLKPSSSKEQQHTFDQSIVLDHFGHESCPKEVEKLRVFLYVFRQNLLRFKRIAANLLRVERLQDYEAKLESTFRDLMHGGKFNVLLVRSDLSPKGKTTDSKASPPNGDKSTDQPNTKPKTADPVLALLHKVLKKVVPDISDELEVYETNVLANGFSTYFVMSNEEKTKEERRIKELENAYRFVQNAPNEN